MVRIEWGVTSHGLMTQLGIRVDGRNLVFPSEQKMNWKRWGIGIGRAFVGVIRRTDIPENAS